MMVDRMSKLRIYVVKAVKEYFFLSFRQMQCLTLGISEEAETAYF